MSLNHLEIEAVVSELAARLVPSRLLRVHSYTKTSCQLVFKPHQGKKLIVFLDLTPKQTRLHLVSAKQPSMASPPAWIMKMRKEIEGMILSGIEQDTHDRVIRLHFTKTPKRPHRTVLATFFDKVGHLVLLDAEDRVVFSALGSFKPGSLANLPVSKAIDAHMTSRFPPPDPDNLASNQAVEKHYTTTQHDDDVAESKHQVEKQIRKQQDQLSRKIQKMRKDLQNALEASKLHLQAQAIKSNLGSIPRNQQKIVLNHPFDPDADPVAVVLDSAYTPIENMQKMFKRSRRLQAAKDQIQARLEQVDRQADRLCALQARLQNVSTLKELELVRNEISKGKTSGRRPVGGPDQPRLPYKTYRSEKGLQIFVGRSARDNHALTFRVARGEDLWLHASEKPGAHVVVRLGGGQQLDEQTLLDAATLAAEASGAKGGDKTEIIYTKAKHVHSIKGASPGLVSVAKMRTIMVLVEPGRLKRLHG